MPLFLDHVFSGADGADLAGASPGIGGAWINNGDSSRMLVLDGGGGVRLGPDNPSANRDYNNAAVPPSPDYGVRAQFHAASNANSLRICARWLTDGFFISLGYDETLPGFKLVQRFSFADNVLSSHAVDLSSAGPITADLVLSGTAATGYLNGVPLLSGTVTLASAGKVAIYATGGQQAAGAGVWLSHIQAGDLPAAVTLLRRTLFMRAGARGAF